MKSPSPVKKEAKHEGVPASFGEMAKVEMIRRGWSYSDVARITGYAVRTVRKEFCIGFKSKLFRERLTEAIGLGHGSK